MATSGYALGNPGDFNGQTYVSWSIATQGPNYTIVNWAYGLRFAPGDGCHQVNQGQVQINGTTVYGVVSVVHTFSSGHNHVGDIQFASGQFQINHDGNGNAQISLYGQSDGSQSGTPASVATGTWALPTITQLPSAPGTPTISGHTDSDPTTATISWAAPSNVGSGLTNVWLQIAKNSSYSPTVVDYVPNAWVTSYNATGLEKGTTYYTRAIAGSSTWGTWSDTATFTTGTTVPGAPSGPAASNVGGTSADITWSAPGDSGGTAITGYQVQRATVSNFSAGLVVTSLPASARSLQITGLVRTTAYFVRVLAINAVGNGPYSSTTSFTTASTVPDGPGPPSIGSLASTAATVSWTAPLDNGGATVTSYQVQYALNSAFTGAVTVTAPSSPKTLTNLVPSTNYWVRVRAVNANGVGSYSTSVMFRTPSGLSVGTGTAWEDANVWIGNGSTWVACAVRTGDGTTWK